MLRAWGEKVVGCGGMWTLKDSGLMIDDRITVAQSKTRLSRAQTLRLYEEHTNTLFFSCNGF